jgi:Zn-dependent protease
MYSSRTDSEEIIKLADFIRGLDWSKLTDILARIIPSLICITLHELAHGYTAFRLGDTTAKDQGRLTLNPVKHIDIFGLLMMVAFKFGWAKPVPVNMHNFKRPKWYMAITALAGPLSNIIISAFFIIVFGFTVSALGGTVASHGMPEYSHIVGFPEESPVVLVTGEYMVLAAGAGAFVIRVMYYTAFLSIGFAIFNMLPIPPLDGSKVLFSLLPDRTYFKLMRYERYGMIFLMILMMIDTTLNIGIFSATVAKLRDTLAIGFNTVWYAAYELVS